MTEENSSKLDNLSKEDLIKLVKKYIILQKQLKAKNEELNTKVSSLEKQTQNSSDTDAKQHDGDSPTGDTALWKEKYEDLQASNQRLVEENKKLNETIQTLNGEIEKLNVDLDEYRKFKEDLEPQLEKARHEIDLNKSMLDMLNNEIKLLNSEKLQLEKKLINTRRNTTPSVIVEEEEEDLEEEERNSSGHSPIEMYTNNGVNNGGDCCDAREDESHDEANHSTDGQLLAYNKELEEMTFYVDELKSELEAEREKNNEYASQIEELKQALKNNNATTTTEQSSTTTLNRFDFVKNCLHFVKEEYLNGEVKPNADLGRLMKQLDENEQDDVDLKHQLKDVVGRLNEKFIFYEKQIAEKLDKEKYLEGQLEKVIVDFKSEISNMEIKINELNEQKAQIEQRVKSLQSELDNERDKSKNIQTKLERYEKEASKSKVLDLEIADYERSIKSLNVQLIGKDKEIGDLKNEIANLNEQLSKGKSDLERTEKERDEEKEKSLRLKQLLVKAKKDVSDAKALEAEKMSQDAVMKAQLEKLNMEIETFKLQTIDLASEREKLKDRLHLNDEMHSKTVHLLDAKLKSTEQELAETKSKLNTLGSEYENYKLKVQHVFKRQKEQSEVAATNASRDGELQNKYSQEIADLNEIIRKLNEKLTDTNERIKLLERENELAQDEYASSLERNTKLLNELREKETQWELKYQELARNDSSKSDQTNELIRNLQTENEAQQNSFKEKIKHLNMQHCQSIDSLQSQLIEAKNDIDRLNRLIDELKSNEAKIKNEPQVRTVSPTSPTSSTSSSSSSVLSPVNQPLLLLKIDDNFKPEESENATARNETRNSKSAKTFEELLNEPTETSSLNSPQTNGSTVDSNVLLAQIEKLKVDLTKSKHQLDHLSELLNESELNNMRLTEQINVLKEEIRRLERNQEREKSISNLEYLKNVVMKFLTLSSKEERTQLIPVLTTMLRLSQEEQNSIINYAKVIGQNESSWGSYFPKWNHQK